MALINPPAWMQNGTYDARTDRLMVGGLIQQDGVSDLGSYVVTQQGSPAMSVLVSAGSAYVSRSGDANLGYYMVRNDGPVTVTITAANATNARIDRIILRVSDAQYSGVTNAATLEVVTGTPSASPVLPALPATSIELARVTVGAGVASIVTANISSATRSIATFESSMINAWCTSTTRPASPSINDTIYETDTKAHGFWDGAGWQMYDSAWQPYTWSAPHSGKAWAGTSQTPQIGTGTRYDRYFRTGRKIRVSGVETYGTGGTLGVGSAVLYLPFNSVQPLAGSYPIGQAFIVDSGSLIRQATIAISSGTPTSNQAILYLDNAAGGFQWGTSLPTPFGSSGDSIGYTIEYETDGTPSGN